MKVGRHPVHVQAFVLGLVPLALLVATACGEAGGTSADAGGDRTHRVEVVTTVAPITSIAAAVIGDNAVITGVVPEGRNSHTFSPRPSDAEALERADVIFVNGLQLEAPTMELAEQVKPSDAPIVELAAETITEDGWIYDASFPEEKGRPNPHLWTDPTMARRYAEIIRDEMVQLDPANADEYTANTVAFAARIAELDAAMRTAFATIPPDGRRLLTYHDAYAYFAEDYGFDVIGAIQPASFEEPTPSDVAELITQVEASGVPAIFGSEVFPSSVLEQLGAETGVRYVDELRDDDLPGDPGGADHSWYGLMRFDFRTMTDALGGDPSALDALDPTPAVPDTATYPQ